MSVNDREIKNLSFPGQPQFPRSRTKCSSCTDTTIGPNSATNKHFLATTLVRLPATSPVLWAMSFRPTAPAANPSQLRPWRKGTPLRSTGRTKLQSCPRYDRRNKFPLRKHHCTRRQPVSATTMAQRNAPQIHRSDQAAKLPQIRPSEQIPPAETPLHPPPTRLSYDHGAKERPSDAQVGPSCKAAPDTTVGTITNTPLNARATPSSPHKRLTWR